MPAPPPTIYETFAKLRATAARTKQLAADLLEEGAKTQAILGRPLIKRAKPGVYVPDIYRRATRHTGCPTRIEDNDLVPTQVDQPMAHNSEQPDVDYEAYLAQARG